MQPEKERTKEKKDKSQNLMKFERPVYQLRRNQEGKVEGIIQKLMEQQKQKPQIGFLPRSHLLNQLDSFIPLLQASNQKLYSSHIPVQQQIDARLQQIEDSSSSSEDEDEMIDQKQKMEAENPQPTILESCDQIEFNIMTYPHQQKQEEKEVVPENKVKIIEIISKKHQMESMD